MEKTAQIKKEKVTIWSKAYINIFIVNFVMSMGQFMMVTLVPKYAYQLGGEASIVGIVTGIFAATALGIRPIAGPAMDYFKKSRLLTLAFGTITLSFICYGFSHSIAMLVIARLIHGVGVGVAAPLSLAMVSNVLPREKMASGLGIFSLGQAISTAFGPSVGLGLAASIGYNNTFFICAVLMFLSFLLSLTLKSPTPVRTERFKIRLSQVFAPEAFIPTTVLLFMIIAYSSIGSFIAIFGGLCGVTNIGLYFTANAIGLIVIRPLNGKLADKYGVDKTVVPGLILLIVGLILVSFCRTLPMFLIAGVVLALGFGTTEPIIQTLNMQLVPKERRGAAGNTNFTGMDIGFLVGPVLAGFAVSNIQKITGNEILGYSVMYRIAVIPVIIAIVIFCLNRRKIRENIKVQQRAFEAGNPAD